MGLTVQTREAKQALREVMRDELRLACGPNQLLSADEERRLPPYLRAAARALRRERPGARVEVDAVVDHAMRTAMKVWERFNPPQKAHGRLLSRAEVGAVVRKDSSLGLLTLRAYEAVRRRDDRPQVKLLALPDVRQAADYTCGVASLQAVLVYYGKNFDGERELERACRTDPEWGTEPSDMVRVAREQGLDARLETELTFDDLQRYLERGVPVIVDYQAWRDDDGRTPYRDKWEDGHYSIVIGLDAEYVYLEDPSLIGELGRIRRDEFIERWHDVERSGNRLHQPGIVITHPQGKRFPVGRITDIP